MVRIPKVMAHIYPNDGPSTHGPCIPKIMAHLPLGNGPYIPGTLAHRPFCFGIKAIVLGALGQVVPKSHSNWTLWVGVLFEMNLLGAFMIT